MLVEQLIGDVPGLTSHYELHISREDGFDRMQVQVEAAADATLEHEALAQTLADHLRTTDEGFSAQNGADDGVGLTAGHLRGKEGGDGAQFVERHGEPLSICICH
mgnify:CR=1 FL=1